MSNQERMTLKKPNQPEQAEAAPQPRAGRVFTYIGQGEDPPRKINFMGVQEFVRGKAVEITDPAVLRKVKSNPAFKEGEVDMEALHAQDEEAAKKADRRRAVEKKIQAAYFKKHGTE